MDKNSINFNKLLQVFKGKWVAVSHDYEKVFASGPTLESVTKQVKKNSNTKFFKVIPFDVVYSP